MPKPRGKSNKKAVAVFEAAKGAELNDAVVAVANGLNEEVVDGISKPDTPVAKEEDASVRATNGRGGRGKKGDNKVVKEDEPAKKAVSAAPKGRGRGKKSVDDEVMTKEVEENAQSNGVASASVEKEQQEEVVTKGKAGSRGKRGAKAVAAKESAVENAEAKENGEVDAEAKTETEKQELVTKTSKGRGKKAAKDTVVDLIKVEPEEHTTKSQELDVKSPAKKTAGRKKKADDKAVIETGAVKDINGKTSFDLLKFEDESLKVPDGNAVEAISEEEPTKVTETEEPKAAAKKTSGRKKKVDDKASTEADQQKETNGKSLFDILKEESEATKDKEENPEEVTLEEETTNAQEPETKPAAKKKAGRKKKADDKDATETAAENEINGKTVIDLPKDEDEEPPKKKGRGAKNPAVVVNKLEETADTKAEEVISKESAAEVSKRPTKRGAKVEETTKAENLEIENKSSKRGEKAQETPKVEDVAVEKKSTKRGRGAVAKTPISAEDVADAIATEEAAPKKRSRKDPSVEKELKPEVEKPKKGRAAAGKRKAEKEVLVEQAQPENDDSKVNAAADATEDVSTKKSEKKAATTNRGGRKRAAPSTNKSKTDAEEDTNKNAAEAITIQDDEADDSKPSKAKKKKKESPATTAAPMNATTTKYNKEDFQLAPLADGQTVDEPRFNLKISSWNVAGLRAWLKKEGLKFLEYEEPDILCLQETKCVVDQLPEEVTRISGYHPYWLCMPGGYAGVAIYSKIMPIHVEYGIGHKDFDDVGRVITAEYEKFFLINAYVPNSGRKLVNLESRMKWEKLFQEFVQKFNDRKPVVICGDMNVSHQEIDLANPKSNTRTAGFTKEERDKLSELLALGYVDTFRHLYPERKGAYTYWTYMSNARARNVGWRLDYFIVSERFTKRVVDNCIRSQCMGSDHCPITLFLKL